MGRSDHAVTDDGAICCCTYCWLGFCMRFSVHRDDLEGSITLAEVDTFSDAEATPILAVEVTSSLNAVVGAVPTV